MKEGILITYIEVGDSIMIDKKVWQKLQRWLKGRGIVFGEKVYSKARSR